MEFQIKYWKKGSSTETLVEKTFKNEATLKKWYKQMWDKKEVEFSFFSGWNRTLDKPVSYMIRTWQ